MDTLMLTVIFIFMIIGIAGTLIPLVPGLPLIAAMVLIYAVLDGFQTISLTVLAIFLLLTGVGMAADFLSATIGAKKYGADRLGVYGSIVGMVIGLLTMGPLGLVLGPLAGAIIGETLSGKDFQSALKTGLGSLIGFLGGALIQFLIALLMVGYFIYLVLI